jgi:hypothetical protein
MPECFTELDVRAVGVNEWQLLRDLTYTSTKNLIGCYTVPLGEVTDLASLPRVIRSIYNVNGISRHAATLHDYLYKTQAFTRKVCDQIFRQALLDSGMTRRRAAIWYRGVRWGGWTRGNW